MYMKYNVLFILIFFVSNAFTPVTAQTHAKHYEQLINDKISSSGHKVSFFSLINNQTDAIIKNINTNKSYRLADVSFNTMLSDQLFIAHNNFKKMAYLIRFNDCSIETIPNIDAFVQLDHETAILENKKNNIVTIYYLRTGKKKMIKNVVSWVFSDEGKFLLFNLNSQDAQLLNISTGAISILKDTRSVRNPIKKIFFERKSNLYYLLSNDAQNMSVVLMKNEVLTEVFKTSLIQKNNSIIDQGFKNALLLPNSTIAIGVKKRDDSIKSNEELEICYGNFDMNVTIPFSAHFGIIDLKQNTFFNFVSDQSSHEFKINKFDGSVYKIVTSDSLSFSKQFTPIDIHFLKNNQTVYNQLNDVNSNSNTVYQTRFSPKLFYFKNNNWFIYDDLLKSNTNVTETMDDVFYNKDLEYLTIKKNESLRNISYFKEDKILISGYNDIWSYNFRTNSYERLTNGKISKNRYFLDKCNMSYKYNAWGWSTETEILYKNDLILKCVTENFVKEVIVLLNLKNKQEQVLNTFNGHFKDIRRNENYITYIKENKNLPPTIHLLDIKSKKEKIIYKSNVWDEDAKNVRSEYIQWKNNKGETRGATILFPSSYNKNLKYPAIVNVYEKKFMKQNYYSSPYEIQGNQINEREYADMQYFVINPDIYYEIGNPAISASNCINETIDEVLKSYRIDKDRIGIFGHSFGGFEVNFILTQTTRFKSAVSSAGVADLENYYLTVNWATLKPDMWRMEEQQWRMGNGLFDIPENYKNNSPIRFVNEINTPTLLVAGKKDYQVNWQQSVMMFLAMKRLNKNVNLLLYKNEGHQLSKEENILDLNAKMKEWFNYNLNGGSRPLWLDKGGLQ